MDVWRVIVEESDAIRESFRGRASLANNHKKIDSGKTVIWSYVEA
jgi:hypothetical protein